MIYTVIEAANEAKCHPETIRNALRAGELHGTQRKKKGTWRVRPECLDAWMDDSECVHYIGVRAA